MRFSVSSPISGFVDYDVGFSPDGLRPPFSFKKVNGINGKGSGDK